MGGNSYIPAAIALAKSLRLNTSLKDIDIVCLITNDVTDREDLSNVFDHVYIVDKINAGNIPNVGGISATRIYHWVSDAPTKWNILSLIQYEKVLFLDADMIVLQDISHLFSLSAPAAMFDHQCATNYVSNTLWTGDKAKGGGFLNKYGKLKTGSKVNRYLLDRLRTHSDSQFALHGGIALIKPDMDLYHKYINELPNIVSSLRKKSGSAIKGTLSAIDEISLSLFMHDQGYVWTHISMEYNVAAYHTYSIFRENTKILHYVGIFKPWSLNTAGMSEREYINIKYEENPSSDWRFHHEVIEIWWNIYQSFCTNRNEASTLFQV